MKWLCFKTVGAGPRACPSIACAGRSERTSGRTQGFAPTVGAKNFSPLRPHYFFIPLFLLLLLTTGNVFADQVTAPLADPAQDSQQEQAANGPENAKLPTLTESQLYDIREPILLPDSNRFLWWIAAVLVGIVLLGLLLYFRKKRTRQQQAVLAHETALRELERAGPLIEEQNINAFITLIDQTLRRYIEQRFGIFARRQTTREFIHGLTQGQEDIPQTLTENSDKLKTWLRHCDLVKFAKAGLTRESMKDMVTNLRIFIESSKMEAEAK